ncbi:SH3 domain-containing protein [Cognatiluteimonas lumbrici]|uniref:hypothetical protein n=1 Tax=Cognatiluteimonas lumbrici TaxID=2559601 RepID=UPI00112E569F|nr:hypothetical protein [Luteimonas lumbrici]
MKRFSCALALVLALGAQAAEPTPCTLEAWSTGTTPAERRIHAGPGADTPVITTMPAPIEFAGFTFRVTLTITEARDGWFRVSLAMADNPILDALPSIVFKGDGWVSGEYLGLVLNHVHLYAEPSGEAAVVAKLAALDEDGVLWGSDSTVVTRLLDCRGDWVSLEGTLLGREVRGWTTGTCANQVTTCP